MPVSVAPAQHDKHAKCFARMTQTKPYKLRMLHICLTCFAHISSTFKLLSYDFAPRYFSNNIEMWLLICKECTCGLKHGQPVQRTIFEAIVGASSWGFNTSWSQLGQNGIPNCADDVGVRGARVSITSTTGTPF